MKQIVYSTQFKKDIKKYRNKPSKLEKLINVFRLLEDGIKLPITYKAHLLKGKYEDCIECHIEEDFLLIWFDDKKDIIEAVRLGSHSELFG